jgi:hypothetical protein
MILREKSARASPACAFGGAGSGSGADVEGRSRVLKMSATVQKHSTSFKQYGDRSGYALKNAPSGASGGSTNGGA